jgi:predicted esterase
MHGMWASPEDSCSFFESAALPHGLLVCPRGNVPFGAGHRWGGDLRAVAARVDGALDAASALGPLERRDGTLIGFSNGAAFALDLAIAQPGRWTSLVLMAMDLAPNAERLKRAGVRRVVFAAGDRDGARFSLERAARTLSAAGIPSRYVSLGPVGHSFAPDMIAKMTDAIGWVRETRETRETRDAG